MSSLYHVKIEEKKGQVVTFNIHIIHPDVYTVPNEKPYFFNLLLDYWQKATKEYFFEGESKIPVPSEKLKELAENSEDNKILKELFNLSYGEVVTITQAEYDELENRGDFMFDNKRVTSYGMNDGKCYITLEADFDTYDAKSAELIDSTKVTKCTNYPWDDIPEFDNDEEREKFMKNYYAFENLPQVSFEVKFSDKLKLDFLLPETEWETATYR